MDQKTLENNTVAPAGAYRNNMILTTVRERLLPLCFAFTGAAFGMISLCAYVYESSRLSVVPYVVTVDKTGAVIARDDLKGETSIPDRVVAADLGSFIMNLRLHTEDKDLYKKAFYSVFAHLKENTQALQEVIDFYKAKDDRKDAYIHAEIMNILRISDQVFLIDWCETGSENTKRCLRSQLTYELQKPTTDPEALSLNPLSLKILRLDISPLNAQAIAG